MLVNSDSRLIPLHNETVQCAIFSPPYYKLRDYGVGNQMGLEDTRAEFIANLLVVFGELWRVLKNDGTVWMNIDDSYAGSTQTGGTKSLDGNPRRSSRMFKTKSQVTDGYKRKDLMLIPHRVAIAVQEAGWYVRQEIIWHKNPMPTSATDRCTRAHEFIFMFTKEPSYYYDAQAIKTPTRTPYPTNVSTRDRYDEGAPGQGQQTIEKKRRERDHLRKSQDWPERHHDQEEEKPEWANKRTVWVAYHSGVATKHFATFPSDLVEPMVLAGAPKGGIILDPFCGSGTVGKVCRKHFRKFVGLDLNMEFLRDVALAKSELVTTEKSISELPLFSSL